MKKRLLPIILVTILILSGCSNDGEREAAAMSETAETQEVQIMEESWETVEQSDEVIDAAPDSKESVETEEPKEEVKESEPVVDGPSGEEVEAEQPKQESTSAENKETVTPVPKPETVQVPEQTTTNTPAPTPAPHSCTWDGGTVTTNATCNSEGVKTFKCTGCGSTRTESIAKTSHNYVTESTDATCTVAGTTRTFCSICGDVQSESLGAAATGHTVGAKTYAWGAPTCTGGSYYNINCAVCGEVMETGTDPALPHIEVATVIRQGDCINNTVISIDCSVCGTHIRTDSREEEIHDWVTGTYDYFNVDTLEWEKRENTKCSRCGVNQ